MSEQLLRSVLYLPGANARALVKARSLPVDALILDLEDAVAPAAKTQAREQVCAALAAGGFGRRLVAVRVNGLDSPWGAADLAALGAQVPDAVVVPKVEEPGQLAAVAAALDAAGAPPQLPLWSMAETPRGILACDAVAAAGPRLACIVLGTSDLAAALRVPHTPQRLGLTASLSLAVLAARAHGLPVLDGVHLDLNDSAGFEAACRQGRDLGFDGKTLIHPCQIAAANREFAPAPEALAQAREIREAWRQAEAAGSGVVVVAGRLVESLHVREAQRLLALADAIAAREPD